MTREERISELVMIAKEWECSIFEAAEALLCDFYEAAGFYRDQLEKELHSKSTTELLEMYLSI